MQAVASRNTASSKLLLVLLMSFIALSALVHFRALASFDHSITAWVFQFDIRPLDWIMTLVTVAGSPEITCITLLALSALFWRRHGWRAAAWLIGLFIVATLIELTLKHWVFQPGIRGLHHRYVFREGFISFNLPYAYPSGHTLRAVFLGGVLARWVMPRAAGVWWTLAAVVAVSRIYLGSHWTTDVIGGVLLGTAALLVLKWRLQPDAVAAR